MAEVPPVAVQEVAQVVEEKKKPKKKMMMMQEDTFQQDEVLDLGSPEDQVEEVQVVSSNAKAQKAQAVSSAPPKKPQTKVQVEEPIMELQVETQSPPVAPLLETKELSVKNIDKAPSVTNIETPKSISVKQIEQAIEEPEETVDVVVVEKVQPVQEAPQPVSRYQEEKEDSVIDELDIELNMIGDPSPP